MLSMASAFSPMAPSFDEPVAMLEACHGRIEAQLQTLEKLVEHLADYGNDAEARDAARFVMRYFDTAGADHHRDEDEDLFPLLRRRAAEQERAEISAVINELEADHRTMELQWSRLRERLSRIAQDNGAELSATDIAGFAWLYRRHIEREAAAVLPFARQALSEAERARLGERMAARRRRKD